AENLNGIKPSVTVDRGSLRHGGVASRSTAIRDAAQAAGQAFELIDFPSAGRFVDPSDTPVTAPTGDEMFPTHFQTRHRAAMPHRAQSQQLISSHQIIVGMLWDTPHRKWRRRKPIMTLSIAWVRKTGPTPELIFASDSRLTGGGNVDHCQ